MTTEITSWPYPLLSDVSHISGNVPDDVKRILGDPKTFFTSANPNGTGSFPIFGEAIQRRLTAVEMSMNKKSEEEKKSEVRYVMEIEVAEDMLNGGGNIHGGCSAFLVDVCSSMALVVHTYMSTGKLLPSVSQSLNLVYHSPATVGDKLRLVNTTLSLGARAQSARTEIWNATHGRLVVSATHIKMLPSAPPKASL